MTAKLENGSYEKSSLHLKSVETADKPQVSYVDHAIQRTSANLNWAANHAKYRFNQVIPPEQSQAIQERYQSFANNNPKLAAFLLINLVFSGVPIVLFTIFSLSLLVFSLVTGIVLGIVAALTFTSTVVGFGLIFLVPTVVLTTVAAVTVFFWGFVGLYAYTRYQQR